MILFPFNRQKNRGSKKLSISLQVTRGRVRPGTWAFGLPISDALCGHRQSQNRLPSADRMRLSFKDQWAELKGRWFLTREEVHSEEGPFTDPLPCATLPYWRLKILTDHSLTQWPSSCCTAENAGALKKWGDSPRCKVAGPCLSPRLPASHGSHCLVSSKAALMIHHCLLLHYGC